MNGANLLHFPSTNSILFHLSRHSESWWCSGWKWQRRGHHQPLSGPVATPGSPAGSGKRQRRVTEGGDAQCRRGEGDPGSHSGPQAPEPRVRGDAAEPQQQHAGAEGELRLRGCVWQVHQVIVYFPLSWDVTCLGTLEVSSTLCFTLS